MDEEKIAAHNSTYPKVAVQWLNQALCFYQSFCLVDSFVLRNRHLRVAAKRCGKLGGSVDNDVQNDKMILI
jgi:hypothetical protein